MLQKQLYATAVAVSHQTAMDRQASEIYRKMVKRMKQRAAQGYMDMQWTEEVPKGEIEERVRRMLNEDGFPNPNAAGVGVGEGWNITWKKREIDMPRVTARELIQMGYNPANGDLFKRILDGLRTAMAEGKVSDQTLQAQVLWVKQNFKTTTEA